MGSQRYVKILKFNKKIRAAGGESYKNIKQRNFSDYFNIELIKKDIGWEEAEKLNDRDLTIIRYIFMHSSPQKIYRTIEKEIIVTISNNGNTVKDVRLITYSHTYSHINKEVIN